MNLSKIYVGVWVGVIVPSLVLLLSFVTIHKSRISAGHCTGMGVSFVYDNTKTFSCILYNYLPVL